MGEVMLTCMADASASCSLSGCLRVSMSLRRLSTVDTRLSETCKQAGSFMSLRVTESGAWHLPIV